MSDYSNNRVQEFSPTGSFIRKFGTLGTANGQFVEPTGLTVDQSGNVWVLNTYGVQVEEFSSEGAFIAGFGTQGTGNGQFQGASAIAISGGNLYVAEWSNSRVQELTTSGTYITKFDEKGSGNGKSNIPFGIASDPSTGNLYVSEVGNNRIQEFSSSGAFIAAFGSAGSGPGQLSRTEAPSPAFASSPIIPALHPVISARTRNPQPRRCRLHPAASAAGGRVASSPRTCLSASSAPSSVGSAAITSPSNRSHPSTALLG